MMGHSAQSPSSGLLVSLHGRWAAALLFTALAIPLVLLAIRSGGLDFRAYYVAAKATAVHLDPYADNRQYGDQFVDVANGTGSSRWIYPPSALFFVAPLALFSFVSAKLLFALFSIAALISTLLYLGRRFDIAPVWLVLTGLGLPVLACVQRGQVDLLILLCVVLAYRFSDRYWSGIPLGIAISIKIFPAALLLWWLLEKRFKAVATAIVLASVVNLLAVWRFGLSSYSSFLHNLTTLHSHLQADSAIVSPLGSWLTFSPGYVGSYNNLLIGLDNTGIFVGFLLTLAIVCLLYLRRVDSEIGFFSIALASQLMNTSLWAMGVVMYLPICLIAIGKARSNVAALLYLIPLYVPSQIRVFGVSPRLVLALGMIAWLVTRAEASRASEQFQSNQALAGVGLPAS